ncbi:MAG: hypothetical protein Q8R72_10795 [Hylemonella sp.]|nr:hypothetical protein [Hylemonella sp.]
MIKKRYAGLSLRPNGTTPEQLTTFVGNPLARYGQAIRDNNIKAE